jgi:hypothetical protein
VRMIVGVQELVAVGEVSTCREQENVDPKTLNKSNSIRNDCL